MHSSAVALTTTAPAAVLQPLPAPASHTKLTPKEKLPQTTVSPLNQHLGSALAGADAGPDIASSQALSPPLDKLDGSSSLQFKKKDFQRSRTLLLQPVLSLASLKSLKHLYTTPKPALERNTLNLLQHGIKNFQSYIQAPVLLLVTNPRPDDDIVIGQRLPFDAGHRDGPGSAATESRTSRSQPGDQHPSPSENGRHAPSLHSNTSDDDIYNEETILQQQKLTLNALKKLSLSLAPIIDSDKDGHDVETATPEHRRNLLQISRKPLNSLRAAAHDTRRAAPENVSVVSSQVLQVPHEPRSVRDAHLCPQEAPARGSKPYLPAGMDSLKFSSLTRQSRSTSELVRQLAAHSPSHGLTNATPESTLQLELTLPAQTHAALPKTASHPQLTAQFRANSGSPEPLAPRNSAGKEKLGLRRSLSYLNVASGNVEAPAEASMHRARNFCGGTLANGNIRIHHPLAELFVGRPVNDSKTAAGGGSLPQHIAPLKKLQQINRFRSPMYIPAVLRKTTDLATDGDDTVPGAADSYFVHMDARHAAALYANHRTASSTPMLTALVSSAMLARSTELALSAKDHTPDADYKFVYDAHRPVPHHAGAKDSGYASASPTGAANGYKTRTYHSHIINAPPMRHHWLKDESVAECGIVSCGKKFNLFERRHHCRKCGGIYCKEHTLNFLYINHLAQFTTGGRGTLSRVCTQCINEYQEFARQQYGGARWDAQTLDLKRSCITVGASRKHQRAEHDAGVLGQDYKQELYEKVAGADDSPKEAVAGSVPANWSWSSF